MRIFLIFLLVSIATIPGNCAPNATDKPIKSTKPLIDEFTEAIKNVRTEYFDWAKVYKLIFNANVESLVALDETLVKIANGVRSCATVKPETISILSEKNEKFSVPKEAYIQWLNDFWTIQNQTTTSMINIVYDRGFGARHKLILEKMSNDLGMNAGDNFHLFFELDNLREKIQKFTKLIQETPTKCDITTYQTKLNGLQTFRNNFRKAYADSEKPLKNMVKEVDALWQKTFETQVAIMMQAANEIKKYHQKAIAVRDKFIDLLNSMFKDANFEVKNSNSADRKFEDKTIDTALTDLMKDCKNMSSNNAVSQSILSLVEGIFLIFLESYIIDMPQKIKKSGIFIPRDPICYRLKKDGDIISMPPLKFQTQRQTINDNVENVQNFLYPFAYGYAKKNLIKQLKAVKNGEKIILNLNKDTQKNLQILYDDIQKISIEFGKAAGNFFVGNLNEKFQQLRDKMNPAYEIEPINLYRNQNYLANEYLEKDVGAMHNELRNSLLESKNCLDDCEEAQQRFGATFDRLFKLKSNNGNQSDILKIQFEKIPDPKPFNDLMENRMKYYGENDPSRLILNTLKASHDEDVKVLIQLEDYLKYINDLALQPVKPFKFPSSNLQYPDDGYMSMINERRNELFRALQNLYNEYRKVCFNAKLTKLQELVKTKITGPDHCPSINLINIDSIDKDVSNRNAYRNQVKKEIADFCNVKILERRYTKIRELIADTDSNTLKLDNKHIEILIGIMISENDRKTKCLNGLTQFIRTNYVSVVERYLESICNDLSKGK